MDPTIRKLFRKIFDITPTSVAATLIQFALILALAKMIALSCRFWPPQVAPYCAAESLGQPLSILPAITLWAVAIVVALGLFVIGSWLLVIIPLGGFLIGGLAVYFLPSPWGGLIAIPIGIFWFWIYAMAVYSKFPADGRRRPDIWTK